MFGFDTSEFQQTQQPAPYQMGPAQPQQQGIAPLSSYMQMQPPPVYNPLMDPSRQAMYQQPIMDWINQGLKPRTAWERAQDQGDYLFGNVVAPIMGIFGAPGAGQAMLDATSQVQSDVRNRKLARDARMKDSIDALKGMNDMFADSDKQSISRMANAINLRNSDIQAYKANVDAQNAKARMEHERVMEQYRNAQMQDMMSKIVNRDAGTESKNDLNVARAENQRAQAKGAEAKASKVPTEIDKMLSQMGVDESRKMLFDSIMQKNKATSDELAAKTNQLNKESDARLAAEKQLIELRKAMTAQAQHNANRPYDKGKFGDLLDGIVPGATPPAQAGAAPVAAPQAQDPASLLQAIQAEKARRLNGAAR